MADIFSKKKRSQVMSAIRSRGNSATEMRFASILRKNGISGWRRHLPISGCPDFVFQKKKIAIFVDGCFWHGCPWHGRKPTSNQAYWLKKLARNKTSDRKHTKELRQDGWIVLRFWQHDLLTEERVIRRMRKALGGA